MTAATERKRRSLWIDPDVEQGVDLFRANKGSSGTDLDFQHALMVVARLGLEVAAGRRGKEEAGPAPTGDLAVLARLQGLDVEVAVLVRLCAYLAACIPTEWHNGHDPDVARQYPEGFRRAVLAQRGGS